MDLNEEFSANLVEPFKVSWLLVRRTELTKVDKKRITHDLAISFCLDMVMADKTAYTKASQLLQDAVTTHGYQKVKNFLSQQIELR